MGQRLDLGRVDRDVVGEREVRARPADQRRPQVLHPPERGAKAGVRMLLRRVDPQRAGDVDPLKRPLVEREERDEALRARGQRDGLVAAAVLEAPEEIDAGARFGRPGAHQRCGRGRQARAGPTPQSPSAIPLPPFSLADWRCTLPRRRVQVNQRRRHGGRIGREAAASDDRPPSPGSTELAGGDEHVHGRADRHLGAGAPDPARPRSPASGSGSLTTSELKSRPTAPEQLHGRRLLAPDQLPARPPARRPTRRPTTLEPVGAREPGTVSWDRTIPAGWTDAWVPRCASLRFTRASVRLGVGDRLLPDVRHLDRRVDRRHGHVHRRADDDGRARLRVLVEHDAGRRAGDRPLAGHVEDEAGGGQSDLRVVDVHADEVRHGRQLRPGHRDHDADRRAAVDTRSRRRGLRQDRALRTVALLLVRHREHEAKRVQRGGRVGEQAARPRSAPRRAARSRRTSVTFVPARHRGPRRGRLREHDADRPRRLLRCPRGRAGRLPPRSSYARRPR